MSESALTDHKRCLAQNFSGYAMSEAVANCLRKLDVDIARIGTIVANETQPLQELALYLRTKFLVAVETLSAEPCAGIIGKLRLLITEFQRNKSAKMQLKSLVAVETLSAEPCAGIIGKLRLLIAEFQRNKNAKMQLKSRLREFKLPEITPAVDTPSRWITTYSMICDVLVTLPAFTEIMTRLNLPPLQETDVQFLEALRAFLEPFYSLTKQVCARDATASVYLAVGRILITTTEK
ncbi:unnamed protein product [Strongylus vulgaris]|uniref:Uncharacterized protein n=1 Tax=Strongylus vulgaris TaxID=40348 RepID=A0A3P7JN48_STRVU|nr:unnamed protein product [Strongylus vulgaris]